MTCDKHNGCDYGCGGCNWEEAVALTKSQMDEFWAQNAQEAEKAGYRQGVADTKERIVKRITLKIAVYGGFQPEIKDVLLDVLKDVDEYAYNEVIELIENDKK